MIGGLGRLERFYGGGIGIEFRRERVGMCDY